MRASGSGSVTEWRAEMGIDLNDGKVRETLDRAFMEKAASEFSAINQDGYWSSPPSITRSPRKFGLFRITGERVAAPLSAWWQECAISDDILSELSENASMEQAIEVFEDYAECMIFKFNERRNSDYSEEIKKC
jgi:hypothetical protein